MGVITEFNPNDYKDYCYARRLSRPSHKPGDTAVMGWREALDLPYWINVAMTRGGYKNPWSWVFEPKGTSFLNNSAKFREMFPEFSCRQDKGEEKKRVEAMEKDPVMKHLRNGHINAYDLAVKYLSDRLKDIKQGVAV